MAPASSCKGFADDGYISNPKLFWIFHTLIFVFWHWSCLCMQTSFETASDKLCVRTLLHCTALQLLSRISVFTETGRLLFNVRLQYYRQHTKLDHWHAEINLEAICCSFISKWDSPWALSSKNWMTPVCSIFKNRGLQIALRFDEFLFVLQMKQKVWWLSDTGSSFGSYTWNRIA